MPEKVDTETGEITPTSCELNGDATVAQRWAWVLEKLPPMGKDATNRQQGFKFRSYDAVMAEVKPLFGKAGVFVLPARQKATYSERVTKNGAVIYVCKVEAMWQIHGVKGDHLTAETVGEGADSFDKATSKAQTMAFKYLLWPGLAIADQADPDATTIEETVPRKTLQNVEEGGEKVREQFRKMDVPTGAKMASQPQINMVRRKANELGIAPEGSEVVKYISTLGEPGWPESKELKDLEAWQIHQLIDHLKKELGEV